MNNATNKDTLAAYNQGVQKYVDSMNNALDGDIQAWIKDSLEGLEPEASILEIGSGTGRDANFIESLGYTVQRTDGSIGFVDYLTAQGHDVKLLDALNDSLAGPYDLVFADAVFLHFTSDELGELLTKVWDALQDGGRLSFSLKRGNGEETSSQKLDAPRYFRYWEHDEIVTFVEKAGFSNVTVRLNDDWREGKPQWLLITAEKGVTV